MLGLVASYNRPGGNATGANILAAEMDGKRVALLHEMMPNVTRVGLLLDPNFPAYATQLNELQQAAAIINLQAEILRAGTDGEKCPLSGVKRTLPRRAYEMGSYDRAIQDYNEATKLHI